MLMRRVSLVFGSIMILSAACSREPDQVAAGSSSRSKPPSVDVDVATEAPGGNLDTTDLCWKYGAPGAGIWGQVDALAGAEPSTASAVVAWQSAATARLPNDGAIEPPVVESSLSSEAANTPVVVCFFDGVFSTPQPPPPPGQPARSPHDRFIVVVIEDGRSVPFVASWRDQMPVQEIDAD